MVTVVKETPGRVQPLVSEPGPQSTGRVPPLVSEAYDVADTDVIIRKQGDTLPVVDEYLKDANGDAVNLSNISSVQFFMSTPSGSLVVSGACTVIDAVAGRVQYAWGASDLATTGSFRAEFQVNFADGTKLTVPTNDYRKVKVVAQLG